MPEEHVSVHRIVMGSMIFPMSYVQLRKTCIQRENALIRSRVNSGYIALF